MADASEDFNIFNGLEEFPYPNKLSTELFKPNESIDNLLFTDFKFVDISELLTEINEILAGLTEELSRLIEHSTSGFIELSNSLSGGVNYINNIKYDLIIYNKRLLQFSDNLTKTLKNLNTDLKEKERMVKFQRYLKYYLIFIKNLNFFNKLVDSCEDDNLNKLESFDQILNIYLILTSFSKFNFIRDNLILEINFKFNHFITNCLRVVLQLEDPVSNEIINKNTADILGICYTNIDKNDYILKLLNVFKLTNSESEFLKIVKENKV